MLSEETLETLRTTYSAIGVIEQAGHELVFRRPSRDQVRDYRRKTDNATEKPDALDQLAQVSIVAFDGMVATSEANAMLVRTAFLAFLEEAPLFTSGGKFMAVFGVMTGLVEAEDIEDLGKGVRVLSTTRKHLAPGSLNGSVPSPTIGSPPLMAPSPQSSSRRP